MSTVEEVRRELSQQLCGCVYWQQSVEYMASAGAVRFVELGPGGVLSGLVRRIAPSAEAVAVTDLDAVSALT